MSQIDARILNIESQINAAMQGRTNVITCPYCGTQNKSGNDKLCCVDFGRVVLAVLRKQAQLECADTGARIADQMARMGMLN